MKGLIILAVFETAGEGGLIEFQNFENGSICDYRSTAGCTIEK
jgi:hypothetical protein